jgi:protein O-mannosyl-transferase
MTSKKSTTRPDSARFVDLWICIFLVIATLLIYLQIVHFDFVDYDDTDYVFQNPHIQAGITKDSLKWAFTTIHASNWHPVTWMSHMLDIQMYGLQPGGHHLTNLLIHIANILLLFIIFKKMTGKIWPSAFIAALFAFHPLHVESVVWVAERKDVLSTFFFLLTLGSYIRYVNKPTTPKYLCIVLFFILGLMSKPMLVTLPFLLFLVDLWPLRRYSFQLSLDPTVKTNSLSFRQLIWEKIPLMLLASVSSGITFYAQKYGGAIKSLELIPFTSRLANALMAYAGYMGKMIYPANLAVLYPHSLMPHWKMAALAGLLLTLISFFSIKMIKDRPYFFAGWFWFLGTLVPVIGLVQVGNQALADRYTYIPLIGLFIIIAWGISDLSITWRHRKQWLGASAGLVIIIFMALTWRQTAYWKDSFTLFEHAVRVTSGNFIAHFNLANVQAKKGLPEEAIRNYRETIAIHPKFADAYVNLGNVYDMQGNSEEAVHQYLQALKLTPDNAGIHYNLGVIYDRQKKIDEAIQQYSRAIKLDPDYEDAYFKLGVALFQKRDFDGSIENFENVLRINPGNAHARTNINRIQMIKNKIP